MAAVTRFRDSRSIRPPAFVGQWLPLPDSSVGVERVGFAGNRFFLKWGQGAKSYLEPSEFRCDGDALNYTPQRLIDYSTMTYHDISVQVNRNTIPYLVAFGYISAEEGKRLTSGIPEPPPPPPTSKPPSVIGSVTETVGTVARTAQVVTGGVVIVALVIAAVYFLPSLK